MKFKNLNKIATNVLNLEILALKKLKKSLNKSFDKAVQAIVNCKSKVIICGVGKSYLVASKISVPNSMFSVGSSTVFPSLSIPSSLKSVTEAVKESAVTET